MKKIKKERKKELSLEVKEIAKNFIETYSDIVNQPISNSFRTVEELGFFVIAVPAPHNISGMTMSIDNKSMIVVNSNQPLGRQNYSIWHEVYHWYTGEGQDISKHGESEYDETEYKAEVFASEILIPRNKLEIELKKLNYNSKNSLQYLKKKDIVKLQNKFNVSYKAMLTRIIFLTGQNKLSNRFAIANKQEDIINLNIEFGFDGHLEKIETKPYISDSLFFYMKSNLEKGRVSSSKIELILDFIEEEFK